MRLRNVKGSQEKILENPYTILMEQTVKITKVFGTKTYLKTIIQFILK